MKWAVLACALVACGDDGGGMTIEPDAGGGSGSADASTSCRPGLDAPWLPTYVQMVVGDLATAPRASLTQRGVARNYIQSQLTQLGLTPMLHSYSTGANVIATIPATTAETRRIIVGAHFDTVPNSPGANDNATGVAAVLAVARFVSEMTCRKYAVTFALLDEEEVGLVGARAYSATLTPSAIVAVHTVDQIGWDMDNDKRFELELPSTALETEYRAAAAIVGVPVSVTSTDGTDHQAFRDDGMPAIGLTEEYVGNDTSPLRHQSTDTAATIENDYLVLGTKLVAQVVMTELAY